jgi:hypothetical protein
MNLFADSSNSNMIYNNLQHLYSYCNELKVHKYTFIYYFLRELYILTFLHPLQLFSKLSKFLKSRLYQLVLVSTVLTFLIVNITTTVYIITTDKSAYYPHILYRISDAITIIILIFRKYWKSRPQLVFLCYTAIIALTFFLDNPFSIILFFSKYWKSQTQLMFMIFISLVNDSTSVNIMILMNIFSRKYCKSHPILVFLIYIVGILGLIIRLAFSVIDSTIFNEISALNLVFIITYFIEYFESQLFSLLIIVGNIIYILPQFNYGLDHFNSIYYLSYSQIYEIFVYFLCSIIICSFFIKIILNEQKTKPKLAFLVPFPGYVTYPKDYNFLKELIKPQSSPFSQTQNNELYKTWNGEAIINFKWRVYSRYYYAGIWILFIIYLACFTLASVPYDIFNNEDRKKLFFLSITFGYIHLFFEIRQFIWSPIRWIAEIWNLLGN